MQPALFSVGGARMREKYVWTLWPALHAMKDCVWATGRVHGMQSKALRIQEQVMPVEYKAQIQISIVE